VAFPFLEATVRLIMIDNYDSFTYNLVQLFYEFDLEVLVFRNDRVTVEEVAAHNPDWICISPGPKDPAHAGVSKAVIERLGRSVPLLGVCLGMQAINEVFGGRTKRSPVPVHGKTSAVAHRGESIFEGIPSPFLAARYHSLCIEIRSDTIIPLAAAADGVIMGIRHHVLPIYGVQFHPESFLTWYGMELVHNFLCVNQKWKAVFAGMPTSADRFPRARFEADAPPPGGVPETRRTEEGWICA
jgi:anthranilate synthase component 2